MTFRNSICAVAALSAVVATAPGLALAGDASPGAAAAAHETRDYVLGPEDVVEVSVLGRADFTTRGKIGSDGTIQLPYLGSVQAANMTATQLRESVTRALERGGYFSNPVLSVNIVSYASRYVTVLGDVASPGLVPVDRPYRLSELVARVGGVKDDGADYVILRSGDAPERRLLIRDLATGSSAEDPYVSPGDKIYVPRAELFFISGQIKLPGAYPAQSDMTLRMALSRGGGLTDAGSDRRIKVTRKRRELAHVNLDDKIQPGDVIVVGERLF